MNALVIFSIPLSVFVFYGSNCKEITGDLEFEKKASGLIIRKFQKCILEGRLRILG